MKRFFVSVPEELVHEIHEQAATEGRTLSAVFRSAIRLYLARRNRWSQIVAYGNAAARNRDLTESDVEHANAAERQEMKNT